MALTTKEFIERAKEIHGNKYDYSKTNFITTKIKVIIICKKHGLFEQLPSSHLYTKNGCKKCGCSYTLEKFIELSNKVHGNKYDYSKVKYVDSKTKVDIICPIHGLFKQIPTSHTTGKECYKCGVVARSKFRLKDLSYFIEQARKIHKDKYFYTKSKYLGATKSIKITCPKHGDFTTLARDHINNNSGCPKCGNNDKSKALLKTTEYFIKRAKEVHKNKYSYKNANYKGAANLIKITCPTHGEFNQLAGDHLNGHGCSKCHSTISKNESALAEWLTEQGESVKTSVRNKIRSNITSYPLELDIYLPSHKLAIEYNGVYWHNEERKGRMYHQDKTRLCYEKGIRLLQFWDHDVKNKGLIVQSIIMQALGRSPIRIYARNCTVENVSSKESSKFFERNHLKGNAGSSIRIGLYFNDQKYGKRLVSCMTFAKPKFSKSHDWEIIRFASRKNYSIIGAASRLYTNFIRSYSPNSIMTYADLMTGTGNVYTEIGMKQCGITKPGYSWVHEKSILSRYSCQKHRLPKLLNEEFRSNLSEVQNMERIGAYRIYDAGNAKFEWFKSTK